MNYVAGNANVFKTVVFRVVTPCSLVSVDQRFEVFAATIFWDELSTAIHLRVFWLTKRIYRLANWLQPSLWTLYYVQLNIYLFLPFPLFAGPSGRAVLGVGLRPFPLGTWMSVCCGCYVLTGGGHYDELISRPEESYRMWCVVVCDLETSWMRRAWPARDCCAQNNPLSVIFLVFFLSPISRFPGRFFTFFVSLCKCPGCSSTVWSLNSSLRMF